MSFTDYEFPNSSYYNSDLRELVRLYKELTKVYLGLKDEIQETIDYVNNFEKHVDEIVNERITITMSLYTQRLIAVENLVKELETQLGSETGNIKRLFEITTDLQNDIDALQMYINKLHQDTLQLLHDFKHEITQYNEQLKDELTRYIYETVTRIERLDVINPITGIVEDINKVLEDLYNAIQLSFGITAREYDELYLTAWTYDQMQITAIDYSTKAFLIFWEMRQGLMRSPFTGDMDTFSNVIWQLSDFHRYAFTAEEYDKLELTASDYDSRIITAFEYDWYGYYKVLRLEDGVITSEKYQEMRYAPNGNVYIPIRNIQPRPYLTARRYSNIKVNSTGQLSTVL